jgi:hypothetical protein
MLSVEVASGQNGMQPLMPAKIWGLRSKRQHNFTASLQQQFEACNHLANWHVEAFEFILLLL